MLSSEVGSVSWISHYIRQHHSQMSRYEIDLYLLDCGCAPARIEASWQAFLTPPKPVSRTPLWKRLKVLANPQLFLFLVLLVGSFIALLIFLTLRSLTDTQQFEQAEKKWQSQNITSYRIQVNVKPMMFPTQSLITVRNGQIVDETCSGIICDMKTRHVYSIEKLFQRVRELLTLDPTDRNYLSPANRKKALFIKYDAVYGFPTIMCFLPSKLGGSDADICIEVASVEILK